MSDQAALYATGSLVGEEVDAFERMLAAGDPAATTAAVEELQVVAEQVVLAAPVPPLRPRVKTRLMSCVLNSKLQGFEVPEPGVTVRQVGPAGYPCAESRIERKFR